MTLFEAIRIRSCHSNLVVPAVKLVMLIDL